MKFTIEINDEVLERINKDWVIKIQDDLAFRIRQAILNEMRKFETSFMVTKRDVTVNEKE